MRMTLLKLIAIVFLVNCLGPLPVRADNIVLPLISPAGEMVNLSQAFTPAQLTGITIHPENALKLDFYVNKGQADLNGQMKKNEYKKLVQYFLTSLTVPDHEQWVNLSPYEQDRIIEDNFGKTAMGRDLLAQDYILKQITSSLTYPEGETGKRFWAKVYEEIYKRYGSDKRYADVLKDIPINIGTFNKVWIVPDQAVVYENANTAYILKSHLKVMLEEDYLAHKQVGLAASMQAGARAAGPTHGLVAQIIRQIILPELEREVNSGQHFAQLRQIVSAMILATWFKKSLKESLLGKIYTDKAKVAGVSIEAGSTNKIYQQYLAAFKKGAYSYIKEDIDQYSKKVIPRKYFSGGFRKDAARITFVNRFDPALVAAASLEVLGVSLSPASDAATISLPDSEVNKIESKWKRLKRRQQEALGIRLRNQVLRFSPEQTQLIDSIMAYGLSLNFARVIVMRAELNGVNNLAEQVEEAKRKIDELTANLEFKDVELWLMFYYNGVEAVNRRRILEYIYDKTRLLELLRIRATSAMRLALMQTNYLQVAEQLVSRLKSNRADIFNRRLSVVWLFILKKIDEGVDFKDIDLPGFINELSKREDSSAKVKSEKAARVDAAMGPASPVIPANDNNYLNMPRGSGQDLDLSTDIEVDKIVNRLIEEFNLFERLRRKVDAIDVKADLTDQEKDDKESTRLILSVKFRDLYLAIFAYYQAATQGGNLALAREKLETDIRSGFIGLKMTNKMDLFFKKLDELVKAGQSTIKESNSQATTAPGGIDLNSTHLDLIIKKAAGAGAVFNILPQELAQLSAIEGFEPNILGIHPISSLPFLNKNNN